MTLPFLPVAEPDIGETEERYVLEAVRSGWVSSIGAFIDRFESDFAAFCGTRHAIALANGTVALHLALLGKEIGPGDEVIVPDLTFVATAAAVHHAGATPVLVDVEPQTGCLDPRLLERAISPQTRAIIPVHLFGQPADMTAIRTVAKRHGLFVIEDAAEAHGAALGGVRTGALGDVACFSFYGNKLLTTGEGGAVTTNDDALAARMRLLKDHAMSPTRRYYHSVVGYNYRITNLQAALGCAQLERLTATLAKKRALLETYRSLGADLPLTFNPTRPGVDAVCWLVTALLPEGGASKRDGLLKALRHNHGVDTRPYFIPVHELPPYAGARLVTAGHSVAADLAQRGFCLPSSARLGSREVERVVGALRSELRR